MPVWFLGEPENPTSLGACQQLSGPSRACASTVVLYGGGSMCAAHTLILEHPIQRYHATSCGAASRDTNPSKAWGQSTESQGDGGHTPSNTSG